MSILYNPEIPLPDVYRGETIGTFAPANMYKNIYSSTTPIHQKLKTTCVHQQ